MNSHNPQSAVTTPQLASAADIASRWWLRLQQPEAAAELAAEFQQLHKSPFLNLFDRSLCSVGAAVKNREHTRVFTQTT